MSPGEAGPTAGAAAPNQGHVRQVGLESIGRGGECLQDGFGCAIGELPAPATDLTVQMSVALDIRPDVKLLATVSTMAVAHQAELLEHVECAVDGRGDGRRVDGTAAFHDLSRRDVTARLRQHVDDPSPLGRPAQTALAHLLTHGGEMVVVAGLGVHRPESIAWYYCNVLQ